MALKLFAAFVAILHAKVLRHIGRITRNKPAVGKQAQYCFFVYNATYNSEEELRTYRNVFYNVNVDFLVNSLRVLVQDGIFMLVGFWIIFSTNSILSTEGCSKLYANLWIRIPKNKIKQASTLYRHCFNNSIATSKYFKAASGNVQAYVRTPHIRK